MRLVFACAALTGAVVLTVSSGLAANDDANYLPNSALTPGATKKISVDALCAPGYTAPPLSDKKKQAAFANYSISRTPGDHVVDFLIPQSLGGSDDLDNLWPQVPKGEFGADKKDELAVKLHDMVCSKQMTLRDAQKAVRKNWVKAYRQYVGGEANAAK